MVAPEILSVRELRAGLAGVLKRVTEPGETLQEAAERWRAVESALGSLRAEGLEPTPEGQELLESIVEGRMTTAQARERILARYGT